MLMPNGYLGNTKDGLGNELDTNTIYCYSNNKSGYCTSHICKFIDFNTDFYVNVKVYWSSKKLYTYDEERFSLEEINKIYKTRIKSQNLFPIDKGKLCLNLVQLMQS
jgi:hypothetical protein